MSMCGVCLGVSASVCVVVSRRAIPATKNTDEFRIQRKQSLSSIKQTHASINFTDFLINFNSIASFRSVYAFRINLADSLYLPLPLA